MLQCTNLNPLSMKLICGIILALQTLAFDRNAYLPDYWLSMTHCAHMVEKSVVVGCNSLIDDVQYSNTWNCLVFGHKTELRDSVGTSDSDPWLQCTPALLLDWEINSSQKPLMIYNKKNMYKTEVTEPFAVGHKIELRHSIVPPYTGPWPECSTIQR